MARTAPEVGKAGRKSASRGAAAKPAMNPRRQRLWRDLALIFTFANLDMPLFVGTAWVPPTIELSTT